MAIDRERGVVVAVLPLRDLGVLDQQVGELGPPAGFELIDADVDLPAEFFRRLTQRIITSPVQQLIDIGEQAPSREQLLRGATPKPQIRAQVRELRIITVNESLSSDKDAVPLRSDFLVAEVLPERDDEACLLDTAKALSSSRGVRALLRLVGGETRHEDTRAAVLLASFCDGEVADRQNLAGHLATRAPMEEELWRREGIGVTVMSDHHVRFVTPRISGFVADRAGRSEYFESKFVSEVRLQYVLAQVVTLWQRIWMDDLLSGVQLAWLKSEASRGLLRSRKSHERLELLRSLRNDHAILIASGTFSPVFESGSQLLFWEELQSAHGIMRRRAELDEALTALAEAAEIEASVNLERLLAFFTLVVGVPSLVFAILGVNISRVTSDTGVSFLLVLMLVVICLLVGAAVYLLASGRGASTGVLRRHLRSRSE